MKNMISTDTKDFPWKNKIKNDPNSPDFKKKKFQVHQTFYKYVPVSSQEYIEGFYFFFLLSYLVCSQIWLNHLMDDRHFNYIKRKFEKKGGVSLCCLAIYIN